jgi:hypothetical protein
MQSFFIIWRFPFPDVCQICHQIAPAIIHHGDDVCEMCTRAKVMNSTSRIGNIQKTPKLKFILFVRIEKASKYWKKFWQIKANAHQAI